MDQELLYKCLDHIHSQLDTMQTQQIAYYLLILTSDHALEYKEKTDVIAKIEQKLVEKYESLTVDDLSKICYSIELHLDQETGVYSAEMSKFLSLMGPAVAQWIAEKAIPFDAMPYLLQAFLASNLKVSPSLRSDLESYVIQNYQNLTPHQAAQLIISAGPLVQNPELIEICEKIIGHGIHQLLDSPYGAQNLLSLFDSMLGCQASRPKMIALLVDTLASEFNSLATPSQIEFLGLLAHVLDETASYHTEIDFVTSIDGILETLEPYFQEKLEVLSFDQLVDTYIGFSHPHTSRRPDILDMIETKLIASVQAKQASKTQLERLLAELSSHRVGSKVLVTAAG